MPPKRLTSGVATNGDVKRWYCGNQPREETSKFPQKKICGNFRDILFCTMRTTNLPRKQELFEQLLMLRRTAQSVPQDAGLAAVRASLERELGLTVSMRLAGQLVGVSHTAIRRWVNNGDLATVYAPSGMREIPIGVVLDLYDQVTAARQAGRHHVIEPGMRQARERAARMDPPALVADAPDDDGHRRAERRALAYHRTIAKKLRRRDVNEAYQLLLAWRENGRIDPRYAEEWERLLREPMPVIRRALGEDSRQMRDLRQSSPFAGTLGERERSRIIAEV